MNHFNRFLLLIVVSSVRFVSPADAEEKSRPNIIVIMADDIGYECLSCYGSEIYQTPNIDKLAASGIRFNHAHSQPICTPSRVQLMTGIHNNRNYIKFGLLDPEATTFAQPLRAAGYKTCIAGKWQLKGGFEAPVKFGFDKYCLWQLTRRPSRYPNPGLEIDGKEHDFRNGEFGPDVISNYICDFMEENKEEPFLVYYPMVMPHYPFVPTPDHPDWDPAMWKDAKDEPRGFMTSKYWNAMVTYTDKMVGKVVNKVNSLGLRDNTLIIWTGDNGTYNKITSRFHGQDYKGGKGSPRDNGTHVGFVASWPSVIEKGQVSDSLVDFTDIYPTLTDVAGVAKPEGIRFDGVSLAPLFHGEHRQKDHIYCWYQRNGGRKKATQHTRDQRYKLYATGTFFDTVEDLYETNDLAASGVPESLKAVHGKLKSALDRHLAVTKVGDARHEARKATQAKESTVSDGQ